MEHEPTFGDGHVDTDLMPTDLVDVVAVEHDADTEVVVDNLQVDTEVGVDNLQVDSDQVDTGQVDYDQVDTDLVDRIEEDLADVERALARLDDGTYGRCEVCGAALSDAELAYAPATRFCRAHLPLAMT